MDAPLVITQKYDATNSGVQTYTVMLKYGQGEKKNVSFSKLVLNGNAYFAAVSVIETHLAERLRKARAGPQGRENSYKA